MPSGYEAADEEAALAAVVAHGLLGSLAVLTGAAFAVRRLGAELSGPEYEALTATVVCQSEVLTEGLDALLRDSPPAFADAAWVIESISRRYRDATVEDQRALLEQLEWAEGSLRDGLRARVQGLSPEAIGLLDSLRHR